MYLDLKKWENLKYTPFLVPIIESHQSIHGLSLNLVSCESQPSTGVSDPV